MKISFIKFPIDIILCMLWSSILLPIVFLDINGPIRIILGLPLILFIPGYILISALFPYKKPEKGIDITERIILSLGLSIVVVSLIGLGLNYTPFGIRLEPILTALYLFILIIGLVAMYRWFTTKPDERFTTSLGISFQKSESKFDGVLTVILVILIIITVTSLVYVIITPKIGERFTEFYLLDPNGKADEYPQNLSIGESATVIIGISNHEYQQINYTIEIWIINQSNYYNESEGNNKTTVDHMWFVDKINISLSHIPINIESSWELQWEYNYTFNITREGNFKLAFLLFTTPTENYTYNEDYKELAEGKINSAYRETHLWITVF